MEFSKPLYFGDVVLCSSQVERFGNTSFVVAHEFRRVDQPQAVASGSEVRVWGYSDSADPAKLAGKGYAR